MKYNYAYRDSQNERHDEVIIATSRDDAFKKIRALGRRPFFVSLAPGFWNKIQSLGKSGAAIVLLAVALCGSIVVIILQDRERSEDYFSSTLRRYPIGDPAIIDEGVRSGWADVFADKGNRFLASYAVPGVRPAVRDATDEEIVAALKSEVTGSADDPIEVRQVKALVMGLKKEILSYLADGGSIASYRLRLWERQEGELSCYQRARAEIETAIEQGKEGDELSEIIGRNNAQLRKMGLCTISRQPY